MECPSCGQENKADAVFCMSCGAALPDVPFSQLAQGEARAPAPSARPEREPLPQPAPPRAGMEGPPHRQATAGGETESRPPEGSPEERERYPARGEPARAPDAPPPAQPPPEQTVEMRSMVEEILEDKPPPAGARPGEPSPPPSMAPPIPAPLAAEERPREEKLPPEPEHYLPPEVDRVEPTGRIASPPPGERVAGESAPQGIAPSLESTQVVAPVVQDARTGVRERKVVCPECYAPNPDLNAYCQECGSPLPVLGTRQSAAARPVTGQQSSRKTAVLTPAARADEEALPEYASPLPAGDRASGGKSFGVADVLAVSAAGAVIAAIALSYLLESFTWKRGVDIMLFSHQGAYTQGRSDLLGGPGILPYEGTEFFTVGMVAAVGVALALLFLFLRVGRGPMYVLSGCTLLFPAAYIAFQAVLPLRQMGIEVDPSVGLSGIFFGNAANPGVGPPFWIMAGAGVLLVAAGFIAPPRGWGRLFTFTLFLGIVLAAAFFCAACFNWNLFIS